ncbi:phosphatidylglycerophosphate phosphatase PTPMT2-like [Rhodamnia argentea]|uniref:phosphatidylglycerophosphatase n=1 Tax=Rhodamnia argentea TaxID=178133 RepID=A0A8B8P5W7_9MYRT|nr:phosphatidylglycerophosphate phosphatase PTPMT2-like [Rhodamnia argentea]
MVKIDEPSGAEGGETDGVRAVHRGPGFDGKRILVGAGARILFYPTLLYNVLRNRLQPEFRWWDEVDEFILLGAVPFRKDVGRLKRLGVHGVITLNEPYETLVPSSLYRDYKIDHLVIPTRDYLYAPPLADIDRAVAFIYRNASCGRKTYVHCKAGRGRSTTVVLCYLVKHKQMTPSAALEFVRSRRPRVLLTSSQWKAVQEYSKQRPATAVGRSPEDAVTTTDADREGYCGISDGHSGRPKVDGPKVRIGGSPENTNMSCLCVSSRVCGTCGPFVGQTPVREAHAG